MANLLSAGEHASLQALAESTMTTPCALLRTERSRDSGGGTQDLWYVATADLHCRVSVSRRGNGNGDESLQQGRLEGQSRWLIRLPLGTPVTEKQRVVVNPDEDLLLDSGGFPLSGTCYEVEFVRDQSSTRVQIVLECTLLR